MKFSICSLPALAHPVLRCIRLSLVNYGLGIIVIGLGACGSTPKNTPDTAYAPNAINIGLAATPDLNFHNNQPHAVTITFYELSKTDAFNRMLTSREGRAQLVIGNEFDKSVLSHRSVVVQPGEFRQQLLDRVEGARYLAAVAGYFQDDPRRISRVYPIRLNKRITFFWRDLDKKPKLRVNMRFGRNGMIRLRDTRR